MADDWKPINVGNQAFLDEDYRRSLQAYGEAVSAGGKGEATARSNRAAAYLKLNKHREALEDASAALKLQPTEVAYYRKGLASFALEEFETSLEAFRHGQQLLVAGTDASAGDTTSDSRKYRTWIRKCEAELEAEEGYLKAAAVADNVTIGENAVTADVTVGENAVTSTKAPQQARAPVSSAHAHLRIKFQYYQSYEKVTVAVLEKGLSEDAVDVVVGMKRLTVRRKGDGGGLLFDKVLHEEILPAKVKTRFMASKLEITLTKKSPADWPELEDTSSSAVMTSPAQPAARAQAPAANASKPVAEPPTKLARPYSSKKNWDVVEKEVQKELDDEKPQGEDALNSLFKQIYGSGDEDTRRAMVKSMQTSGGTVLSTNWDEVAKADYEKERQAPKGMVWKTWEGDKLPQKDDDDDA
eukprot:jgi/Undpi1/1289/HiC_scaffold_11.g04681.m1